MIRAIVLGLPRSRTAWAATFLSQPDCPAFHDPERLPVAEAEAPGDYIICDTGTARAIFRDVADDWSAVTPETKLVILRRSERSVAKSLLALEDSSRVRHLIKNLYQLTNFLDQIEDDVHMVIDVDQSTVEDWSDLYKLVHGVTPEPGYVKQMLGMHVEIRLLHKNGPATDG